MEQEERNNRVYPVEKAGSLEIGLRKLVQNPRKILKSLIRPGMTVLDLGCGPGFFTIEIAKMLNGTGKVIAADLQEGMLEKIKGKISGTLLENKIELHKCEADRIGLKCKVDLILAFYVVHEIKDHNKLFEEMTAILKPEGKIYIVEPAFHVSGKDFNEMVGKILEAGLEVTRAPGILFSRSIIAALLSIFPA
jgi:ubiquinone/menaquinone biosynthesis C-methylase UbiE